MTDFTEQQIEALAERVLAKLQAGDTVHLRRISDSDFIRTVDASAAICRECEAIATAETKLKSLPICEAKEVFAKAFAEPAANRQRWDAFADLTHRLATIHERIDILQRSVDRHWKQLTDLQKWRDEVENRRLEAEFMAKERRDG